jgi:hypothetical protein
MRALSLRQASRCETAKHRVCHCRCHGALHGVNRAQEENPDRAFFETLDAGDPHRLPTKEEQKQKRKDRAYMKKSGKQGFLGGIFEETEEKL